MNKLRIFYDDGTHIDIVPPKLWKPCEDAHCIICNPLDDPDLYRCPEEAEEILREAGFLKKLRGKARFLYWDIIQGEDTQ